MLLIQWGSVGTVKNSVSSCSTQGYNGKPSIPRQPPFPAEWWWILQWWAHWNQPLKQHTLLPQGFYQQAATNSSVNLWDTKCMSGGLIRKSNYFAPWGKPSESRASPPPVRGTGTLSAIAERGQPVRDFSSKPNSSHRKTLLPGTESSGQGFYQGSSLDMGFSRWSKAGSGL